MQDNRNVIDEFKGKSEAEIIETLDQNGVELEIAIENLERDFNMGTIVRNANAFGVRRVHVIGRRQWNKRGAMATDKYLHVDYFQTVDEFVSEVKSTGRSIIAIDNVQGSVDLLRSDLPENAVLVFGTEGPGISAELLQRADQIIAIEQLGSTRSVNVGVASGVAIYEWLRRNNLQHKH